MWLKRSTLGVNYQSVFGAGASGGNGDLISFANDNTLRFWVNGGTDGNIVTTQVFRDVSAWYHILYAVDTTQATSSNRIKLYVNGTQVTAVTATYPTQNYDFGSLNTATAHEIGRGYSAQLDGYLANIHFIDGQALTPSSFTKTDATTGQLIPKTYTGSYGTNGFNLLFADNSSNTASTLGKDYSGLGNNWTPNNFSVVGGPTTITTPASNAPPTVDYLVVAGGGGGGYGTGSAGRGAGGGGAGGLLTASSYSITSGTSYSISVGQGGAAGAGSGSNGSNGENSVFGTFTAVGGGGGAAQAGGNGSIGGSGGGGGAQSDGSSYGLGAVGTAGQGNTGGNGHSTFPGGGGGGGGAGGVGQVGTAGAGGAGGAGVSNSYSGGAATYATGGAGGGATTPVAGSANTGNGGGGATQAGVAAAAGGSGIVIIRYSNTYGDLTVGSGLTYTYANTGGYKIYSFTASVTAAQSAGNDSLVDSPTNYGTDTAVGGEVRGNYCTLNPLDNGGQTLANGNLDITGIASNWRGTRGTIGMSSGKWYWEVTISFTNSGSNQSLLGIATNAASISGNYASAGAYGWEYYSNNGNKFNNGSNPSYGAAYTSGDVIGIAFDADSGSLTFYKNGSSQGTAYTGLTSGPYFPSFSLYGTSLVSFNGGQRAFAYTAPSGFKALCTQNLPAPLVTKSNTAMDAVLYTGNSGSQAITLPGGFSPDLVWLKSRSNAYYNHLIDTVRGSNKVIWSNLTDAETTSGTEITSFNSDGFTLGSGTGVNGSGSTYVGWAWDAGTSTVSNTQGSITSQVRANATAGFSVVKYTTVGSTNSTVGHGLGVAPRLLIVRYINQVSGWFVYHADAGAGNYLQLQTTGAASALSSLWNNTTPTSTVFSIGTAWTSSVDTIAYCFSPVVGYSSVGSYVGNGSSDGVFVYTGFRPRFILVKNATSAYDWRIHDTARDTYNVAQTELFPNGSYAEAQNSAYYYDILSNGFKLRTSDIRNNGSGDTYIYYAVAESPFNYSRAR